MIVRKIIGRYVIGEVIIQFLIIFEKLINTHGLERLLGRLQEIEHLVTRSKGLNLDKKEIFFKCIRLLTEQENLG